MISAVGDDSFRKSLFRIVGLNSKLRACIIFDRETAFFYLFLHTHNTSLDEYMFAKMALTAVKIFLLNSLCTDFVQEEWSLVALNEYT